MIAVIGANYGDEGKGQVCSKLSRYYIDRGHKVLNVLYNGGFQRGHTVIDQYGKRIVCHTRGAGRIWGADTHYDRHFMIDPVAFACHESETRSAPPARLHIDKRCRVVTPLDVLANHACSSSSHNTCGMGLYATTLRHGVVPLTWEDIVTYLSNGNDDAISERLGTIAEYYRQLDIEFDSGRKSLSRYVSEFISAVRVLDREVHFLGNLFDAVKAQQYDIVIFEGGQGLAISEKADPICGTPSDTGLGYIKEYLNAAHRLAHGQNRQCFVYVTRPYFTRHGEGRFNENENLSFPDSTNVTNDWQGKLRFGDLDPDAMLDRIDNDVIQSEWFQEHRELCVWVTRAADTHAEKMDGMVLAALEKKAKERICQGKINFIFDPMESESLLGEVYRNQGVLEMLGEANTPAVFVEEEAPCSPC
jgi:adenylosuccinate synthase